MSAPASPSPQPVSPEDIRTTVLLLAAAAFFSGAALRLCDGLLPRLAEDFAISPGTAGQVVLYFSIAYGLMQLMFGPLGDRFGKARMVGVALAGCAVMAAAAAVTTGFPALLWVRVVWGMAAAGIIPLAMAWIGDSVPYEIRQATLARLLLGTLSGMTAGQLAGGLFGDADIGWRGAFATMALGYTLIASLLAWRLWRMARAVRLARSAQGVAEPQLSLHPPATNVPVAGAQRASDRGVRAALARFINPLRSVVAAPWNRRVLAACFVEGMFLLGPLAFMPALLHQRFGLSLSAAAGLIAFYAIGGLTYALLARRLVLALGERRMVKIGGGLVGLGFAAWWLSPVPWTAAPVALLIGFGTYLYHNTLQTLATQMAPEARGTAVSIFAFCLFFGQALGVSWGGWAFDHLGPAGLLAGSVLALPLAGWAFGRALAARQQALQQASKPAPAEGRQGGG